MWAVAFAVASTAITYQGYNQQAEAAQQEGALTARNIKENAKMMKLKALQEHNTIMADNRTYMNTNAASAGVMGRDTGSDRSIKAIREKALRDTEKTVQRANLQSLAELSKAAQQEQMTLVKANNLSKAYRLKAFSAVAKGAYNAYNVS
tara:strand:- start:8908 stop:9354 length:447 start_codon:yes stop_codon:yes gene_type:complete